jgi:hypothetical protein
MSIQKEVFEILERDSTMRSKFTWYRFNIQDDFLIMGIYNEK